MDINGPTKKYTFNGQWDKWILTEKMIQPVPGLQGKGLLHWTIHADSLCSHGNSDRHIIFSLLLIMTVKHTISKREHL